MADRIRKITLNGAELGYCIHEAEPGKQALIFLHGYAMRSTGTLYEELLVLLGQQHTVYALDLRGHGASASTVAGWSFEATAADVVGFSEALNLEQPVLVGHSFGAVIALLAELSCSGRFKALCLLSPGPADHRRDPVDTLEFLIEHGQNRDALRGGFRQMFVRPPGQLLDVVVDAVPLVDTSVHRAQQAQGPHFSIDDRLKDVAVPVLLVRGGRDTVVAPVRQHDMAEKLPRSKEVVFSTEGHMLANESAAAAAREVLSFLDHDRPLLASAAKMR